MRGGYCIGTDVAMSPSLNHAHDAVNDSSTSRSRVRHESRVRGRVMGSSTSRNTTHRGIQMRQRFTARPNAPSYPRAIIQATCGPVRTSAMLPSSSPTYTSASTTSASLGPPMNDTFQRLSFFCSSAAVRLMGLSAIQA